MTKRQSKAGQKGKPALREFTPAIKHRLFPAFAALWFAALFGLGSLAISSSVLGSVAVMTGLPAIIPAAAPPLGFTAHALFALVLAIAGAAIGAGIALAVQRRLAAQEPVPVYAPLRRSAAATPTAAPAPAMPEAPKVRARDAHPDAPPRRPLELTEALVADAIPGGQAAAELATAPALERVHPDMPTISPARGAANVAEEDDHLVSRFEPDLAFEPDVTFEDEPILLSELAPPELPEPEPAFVAPAPAPLQEAAINVVRAAGLTNGDGIARKLLADLPIDGLGMIQLIERLALALDTRRSAEQSAPAGADIVAHPAPLEQMPAEPSPPPVFAPPRFAQPLSGPANGPAFDAAGDKPASSDTMREETAASSPAASPSAGPSTVPPLSALTERYASLLAAESAAAESAGRTATDPVLQFPGEAARQNIAGMRQQSRASSAAKAPISLPRAQFASAEDADAALREALATLKRMASQG